MWPKKENLKNFNYILLCAPFFGPAECCSLRLLKYEEKKKLFISAREAFTHVGEDDRL